MAKIDLNDRKNYKITFQSIAELEEMIGIPAEKLFKMETLTLKQITIVIWSALWHIDRTLEVQDVYDMLDREGSDFEKIGINARESLEEYFKKHNKAK